MLGRIEFAKVDIYVQGFQMLIFNASGVVLPEN